VTEAAFQPPVIPAKAGTPLRSDRPARLKAGPQLSLG